MHKFILSNSHLKVDDPKKSASQTLCEFEEKKEGFGGRLILFNSILMNIISQNFLVTSLDYTMMIITFVV